MKLDAHPLIVAVALGVLGPVALFDDECDETECQGAQDTVAVWEPGPTPSAEEFHRVELEWLKQT